jgi:hypothetical protein
MLMVTAATDPVHVASSHAVKDTLIQAAPDLGTQQRHWHVVTIEALFQRVKCRTARRLHKPNSDSSRYDSQPAN